MEEIIRQLEHTIKYFKDAQTDFQRGRVFEAEKILQSLRIHDVVWRSEPLLCCCDNPNGFKEMEEGKEICSQCGKPY